MTTKDGPAQTNFQIFPALSIIQAAPPYNIKLQGKVELGRELTDMLKSILFSGGGKVFSQGHSSAEGKSRELPFSNPEKSFYGELEDQNAETKHPVYAGEQHIYGQHSGAPLNLIDV